MEDREKRRKLVAKGAPTNLAVRALMMMMMNTWVNSADRKPEILHSALFVSRCGLAVRR